MSKVAIKGNASGTGTFTLEAPNSNTDRTLVLPDEAGTVLTSASTYYPDPPRFFVGLISGITGLTETTSHTVPLNSIQLDTANAFNTTNSWYVIPETGCYWISGAVIIDEVSGSVLRDAIGWIEISTDSGSTWTDLLNSGFRFNANEIEGATLTMSGVHELTVNTLVRLRAYVNNTDSSVFAIRPDTYAFNVNPTMSYTNSASGTHLTGYRIA